MNGSEPPRSDDSVPQMPPSESPRFLLEWIFLGPDGVRAGWRAAFYIALFFLFMAIAAMAVGLLHLSALAPGGTLTPAMVFTQDGLAALCAVAAALVLGRLEGRCFGDYGIPLAQALRKSFWLGGRWGNA